MSLCRRCEKRALAYETNHGPRAECTWFGVSKHSCYCYEPVKPAILRREKGDKRPQFAAWVIAARSEFAGVENDLILKIIPHGNKGNTLIWVKKEWAKLFKRHSGKNTSAR